MHWNQLQKAEEIGFYACPFCAKILAADVPEEHRFTKNQVCTPLIDDSPPDGHHSGQHQLAGNLQVPEDESDGQQYNSNQHLNVCFECKNSIESEDPLRVHDQRSNEPSLSAPPSVVGFTVEMHLNKDLAFHHHRNSRHAKDESKRRRTRP